MGKPWNEFLIHALNNLAHHTFITDALINKVTAANAINAIKRNELNPARFIIVPRIRNEMFSIIPLRHWTQSNSVIYYIHKGYD